MRCIYSCMHIYKKFNIVTEIYYEKQRYDGWYNNRAYPDWGSVGKWLSTFDIKSLRPTAVNQISTTSCGHCATRSYSEIVLP